MMPPVENIKEINKIDKGVYSIVYNDGTAEKRSLSNAERIGLSTKLRHYKARQEASQYKNAARSESNDSVSPSQLLGSEYPDQTYADHYPGKSVLVRRKMATEVSLKDLNFVPSWADERTAFYVRQIGVEANAADLSQESYQMLFGHGNPGESVKLGTKVQLNELTLYKIPREVWIAYHEEERKTYTKRPEDMHDEYIRRGGMQTAHPVSGKIRTISHSKQII